MVRAETVRTVKEKVRGLYDYETNNLLRRNQNMATRTEVYQTI
jgi:hypothetical protein